jgi:2-polyprenyl-6-methoxyphenol hydroxylase-like FAD-dependent oxidoreductase
LICTDVVIVGAGPAGVVAALTLAPTRRVVLVDRREHSAPRIGEALPGAARRLLTDMGLFDGFLAQGYPPWYGNRSVWGCESPRKPIFSAIRTAMAGTSIARGSILGCARRQRHVAPC